MKFHNYHKKLKQSLDSSNIMQSKSKTVKLVPIRICDSDEPPIKKLIENNNEITEIFIQSNKEPSSSSSHFISESDLDFNSNNIYFLSKDNNRMNNLVQKKKSDNETLLSNNNGKVDDGMNETTVMNDDGDDEEEDGEVKFAQHGLTKKYKIYRIVCPKTMLDRDVIKIAVDMINNNNI